MKLNKLYMFFIANPFDMQLVPNLCPLTEPLAAAFQTVGGVVPTRTPKEILKNVKLVVADQQATLVGTDQEVEYVYPRGHVIKNAIASVWGTRCRVVYKYSPDDALKLEAVFPRGDGFNPNFRGLTADELRELRSRKPPIGCRMREVKAFLRRTDASIKQLFTDSNVRDDDVGVIRGGRWSVFRIVFAFINLARALLDPSPDLPFAQLRELGRNLFLAYKQWLAKEFPFTVRFDGPNRGQFDDSRPNNGQDVTGADLRGAIESLLAGTPVNPDQKPSIGCNIKWK